MGLREMLEEAHAGDPDPVPTGTPGVKAADYAQRHFSESDVRAMYRGEPVEAQVAIMSVNSARNRYERSAQSRGASAHTVKMAAAFDRALAILMAAVKE